MCVTNIGCHPDNCLDFTNVKSSGIGFGMSKMLDACRRCGDGVRSRLYVLNDKSMGSFCSFSYLAAFPVELVVTSGERDDGVE